MVAVVAVAENRWDVNGFNPFGVRVHLRFKDAYPSSEKIYQEARKCKRKCQRKCKRKHHIKNHQDHLTESSYKMPCFLFGSSWNAAFWCQVIYEPTGETLRVPFRRIHLTDEDPGCDHLDVYDTSGPVGPSLSAFAQAVHLVSCLSCSSCFTVRSKKSAVRLIIEAALLSWPPCYERWQLTAVLWGTSPREGLPKLRKEWVQRRAAAAGIPGENALWKFFKKKTKYSMCI